MQITLNSRKSTATISIPIAHDSLTSPPISNKPRETSVNGQSRSTRLNKKGSLEFTTSHLKGSKVTSIETFLESEGNICDVEGFTEGTYKVILGTSEYTFFYQNGSPQVTGQKLTITLEQIPEDSMKVGEEGSVF